MTDEPKQSKNPFAPNYVKPWRFKVADLMPNWLTGVILLLGGSLMFALLLSNVVDLLRCK